MGFKLHAIDYAKEHGNRAHERCFLSQLRTVEEEEEITEIIEEQFDNDEYHTIL